jgi:hypothetical protein
MERDRESPAVDQCGEALPAVGDTHDNSGVAFESGGALYTQRNTRDVAAVAYFELLSAVSVVAIGLPRAVVFALAILNLLINVAKEPRSLNYNGFTYPSAASYFSGLKNCPLR